MERFRAKDPRDLLRAIEAALASERDVAAAAALADRYTWERVFESELAALQALFA